MSGRIGQRLEPGERVVCRLPTPGERRDWRRILIVAAALLAAIMIAAVVAFFLQDSRLVIGLGIIVPFAGALSFAEDNTTDAAVSDRRLLAVTGWNPTVTTEVKPDEIESVEVLRGGLRVRRRDGPPIILARRRGSAELAAAIAQLAKLPPPPGPRDLAADRVMLASILIAGYSAGLACLALLTQLAGTQEVDWRALYVFSVPIAAALAGALLGVLVGLVLVRARFTRAEMRAWIEGSAGFAQVMASGGLCARLARRYRTLADRLYGPPPHPDNTGAESHGR